MTWEPYDQGSNTRVDSIYHYHVVYLGRTNYEANTTNTTVILSGLPHNTNISFIVSASNCEGKSLPITLTINISTNAEPE